MSFITVTWVIDRSSDAARKWNKQRVVVRSGSASAYNASLFIQAECVRTARVIGRRRGFLRREPRMGRRRESRRRNRRCRSTGGQLSRRGLGFAIVPARIAGMSRQSLPTARRRSGACVKHATARHRIRRTTRRCLLPRVDRVGRTVEDLSLYRRAKTKTRRRIKIARAQRRKASGVTSGSAPGNISESRS